LLTAIAMGIPPLIVAQRIARGVQSVSWSF
jgi:hypothetical protein